MTEKKVPEGTISRLFLYLREVSELSRIGIKTVSSAELGDRTNLSDAQVRKDLGYFGQFGVSGSGYDTNELKKALEKILGKDKTWNVAVVGVGHLASALLSGWSRKPVTLISQLTSRERTHKLSRTLTSHSRFRRAARW